MNSRMWMLAFGMVAGCGDSGAKDRPDFSAALCSIPQTATHCPPEGCGPNSPIANEFPVNGLSADGTRRCNPAGVELIPRSLAGGGCGDGADLFVDDGRLVGKRNGKVVCSGVALAGASFLVRSFQNASLMFTIGSVRQFSIEEDKASHEGYRIESGGAPVCDPAVSRQVRRHLGLYPRPEDADADAGAIDPRPVDYVESENNDLAMPLFGPIYDATDAPYNKNEKWLQFACVNDALAKRTLHGLTSSNEDDNTSALRMLTSNYCGNPYSVHGIKIDFEKWIEARGDFEARWGGEHQQALCIEQPRLMRMETTSGTVEPKDLAQHLRPGRCKTGQCTSAEWTDELRAECKLAKCSETPVTPHAFESWFHNTDKHTVFYGRIK